jgi:hypothetical protein
VRGALLAEGLEEGHNGAVAHARSLSEARWCPMAATPARVRMVRPGRPRVSPVRCKAPTGVGYTLRTPWPPPSSE